MAEAGSARIFGGLSLGYRARDDTAAVLGLHIPTEEEQAAGLMPHWEPIIILGWDEAPALFRMLLDTHAEMSPTVGRKRQLEAGELTPMEAWEAAQEEMGQGPGVGPGGQRPDG